MATHYIRNIAAALVLAVLPAQVMAATCELSGVSVTLGLGVVAAKHGEQDLEARCLFMEAGGAAAAFCGAGEKGKASTWRGDDAQLGAARNSSLPEDISSFLAKAKNSQFPKPGLECVKKTFAQKADLLVSFLRDGKLGDLPEGVVSPAPASLKVASDNVYVDLIRRVADETVPQWVEATARKRKQEKPVDESLTKAIAKLRASVGEGVPDNDEKLTSSQAAAELDRVAAVVEKNYLRVNSEQKELIQEIISGDPKHSLKILKRFGCTEEGEGCAKSVEFLNTQPAERFDPQVRVFAYGWPVIVGGSALAAVLLGAAGLGGWFFGRPRAPAITVDDLLDEAAQKITSQGGAYLSYGGPLPADDELGRLLGKAKNGNWPIEAVEEIKKFRLRWLLSRTERDELRRITSWSDPSAGTAEGVRKLLDILGKVQNRMGLVVMEQLPDTLDSCVAKLADLCGEPPSSRLQTLVDRACCLKPALEKLERLAEDQSLGREEKCRAAMVRIENERIQAVNEISSFQPGFTLDQPGLSALRRNAEALLEVIESRTLREAVGRLRDELGSAVRCRRLWEGSQRYYPLSDDESVQHFNRLLGDVANLIPSRVLADVPAQIRADQKRCGEILEEGRTAREALGRAAVALSVAPENVPGEAEELLRRFRQVDARRAELEPFPERFDQAAALAKAWDAAVRPILEDRLFYRVPDMATADAVSNYFDRLSREDETLFNLRLGTMVAAMTIPSALTALRDAGREDIIRLLGFAAIDEDLKALFMANDPADAWKDVLLPGLVGGTVGRVMRADVLLATYFHELPACARLKDVVSRLAFKMSAACAVNRVVLTVPDILCPPKAGVETHFDSLPELRAMPEVRERVRDALARREMIAVDVHNIGIQSPEERHPPGVVLLNPADW